MREPYLPDMISQTTFGCVQNIPEKKNFTISLGCNFVIDINTDSNLQWLMAMITMHHQLCGKPGPQGHRGRIGLEDGSERAVAVTILTLMMID